MHVTFTLNPASELSIRYEAVTDAPTHVNLTNHAYFNLAGTGDILGHVMMLNADSYTPTDAGQIPTGKIASVAGTPLDFRTPIPIGARIETENEDLKYGMGEKVDAFVIDADGVVGPNPQLALYVLGALAEFDLTGSFSRARLVIHQPRLNHVSEFDCTIDELRASYADSVNFVHLEVHHVQDVHEPPAVAHRGTVGSATILSLQGRSVKASRCAVERRRTMGSLASRKHPRIFSAPSHPQRPPCTRGGDPLSTDPRTARIARGW